MSTTEEHSIILNLVSEKSTVLDLGCGKGELLSLLIKQKNIKGQGIEIDEQAIYACVAEGLSVFHDDLDNGLLDYQDNSFDYVIMNQTLQEVRHPDTVLKEALRVGKKVIVGFPNFAYWKARFQLFITGRVPVTASLPHKWYNTPNLHFLSIADFTDYCKERGINILDKKFLPANIFTRLLPNLFAQTAIITISR